MRRRSASRRRCRGCACWRFAGSISFDHSVVHSRQQRLSATRPRRRGPRTSLERCTFAPAMRGRPASISSVRAACTRSSAIRRVAARHVTTSTVPSATSPPSPAQGSKAAAHGQWFRAATRCRRRRRRHARRPRIRVRSRACEERQGHSRSRSVHRRKALEPERERSATFSFSAEDAEGFECKLDHRDFKSCSSPVLYEQLDEGEHAFRVRATARGKSRAPATKYSWRIDLTAPTTTITEKPSRPTAETNADFSFTANEEVERFECKLDGGPFAECISPRASSAPSKTASTSSPSAQSTSPVTSGTPRDTSGGSRPSKRRSSRTLSACSRLKASKSSRLRSWSGRGADRLEGAGRPDRRAELRRRRGGSGRHHRDGRDLGGDRDHRAKRSGQAEEIAVTELTQAGFVVSVDRAESDTVAEGYVSAQSRVPVPRARPGDTVEITVSLGSSVPD